MFKHFSILTWPICLNVCSFTFISDRKLLELGNFISILTRQLAHFVCFRWALELIRLLFLQGLVRSRGEYKVNLLITKAWHKCNNGSSRGSRVAQMIVNMVIWGKIFTYFRPAGLWPTFKIEGSEKNHE